MEKPNFITAKIIEEESIFQDYEAKREKIENQHPHFTSELETEEQSTPILQK